MSGVRIGCHVSIAGGVATAVERAIEAGGNAFQIFTRNPRGWGFSPLKEEETEAFRKAVSDAGILPVAHMPYLPNLAGPDGELFERSVRSLASESERCRKLDIPFLVTHLGSHKGTGEEMGRGRIIEALRAVLDSEGPMILLENTAGTKNSLGSSWEEIARIVDGIGGHERLGLCLDTAHAFAAGYDLSTGRSLDSVVKSVDSLLGIENVKVIHLNDSKIPMGGRADRHEHLGLGEIGESAIRRILRDRRLRNITFILETPEDERRVHSDNVGVAWGLAGLKGP